MSADADTGAIFKYTSRFGLIAELKAPLARAFAAVGLANIDPVIRPAARPEFGDFQVNGLLAAGRTLKKSPRALAEEVYSQLAWQDFAQKVEVAGPGYLNIFLRYDYLCRHLDDSLMPVLKGSLNSGFFDFDSKRVVVDMSSPNLAKEMHVGHLRSTIIGDAIARILECFGHDVVRQNHVGDWGTQFGMLIAYMQGLDQDTAGAELADLEVFYQKARQQFDADEAFAKKARESVVHLQSGDAGYLASWEQFRQRSLAHCELLYARLNVKLKPEDIRGESAYNDQLADIIEVLEKRGLVQLSEGAKCVFLDGVSSKDGQPHPLIVQKSDGGYLYATTDLAAVRYRSEQLQADIILYLVDARQSLHFRQVFEVARQAGFVKPDTALQHLPFGMVMGRDNKPLKTRQGGVVKLQDLLDEAEERAFTLMSERSTDFSKEKLKKIARVVGVGAVKYADLSKNRLNNYVFDWDAMLSLEGNTAVYLLYAYARIQSLLRKTPSSSESFKAPFKEKPQAHTLALHLSHFPEALVETVKNSQPHFLCTYLYELATRFSVFYEHCPVMQAESDDLREQRLRLCWLTGEVLEKGLALLGIEVLDEM